MSPSFLGVPDRSRGVVLILAVFFGHFQAEGGPQESRLGELKQLSGQENSFLEIEKLGLPQHIASVVIYDQNTAPDGIVFFKHILEHLESRLHLSGKLP